MQFQKKESLMAKKSRFYAKSEASMESRDSKMLSNDYSAVANMPQGIKYHAWPKGAPYASYSLDDTITGIDSQMSADVAGMNRHRAKSKY